MIMLYKSFRDMDRKTRKGVTVDQWTVHAIIKCEDCGWGCDDHAIAEEKGKEHALQTGHTVKGEIGQSVTYSRK